MIARVIHMPPITWATVWIFNGIFVVLFSMFHGNLELMAMSWLIWGLINFYGNMSA